MVGGSVGSALDFYSVPAGSPLWLRGSSPASLGSAHSPKTRRVGLVRGRLVDWQLWAVSETVGCSSLLVFDLQSR